MSVDASIDHVVGILIVDRDDEVSAAWSGSLVASGYRLAWVDSAGQALVELARQRPDLLICNADLPDLAIDALCMAIRSSPDIRDVPVLAILSLSEGDSTKYQKSTARSFLTLESPQKTENKAR